jgi:hypothetical protein
LALGLLAGGLVASAPASVPANGRAWELVTPPEPVGASVSGLTALAPGGERLVYSSLGPIPGAPGGDFFSSNLAIRTSSGWRSKTLGGPYSIPWLSFETLLGPTILRAYDSRLTSFVLSSYTPLLPEAPPEPRIGLYRADDGSGISLLADLGETGGFRGASDATDRVFFTTQEHLLPGDAGRTEGKSLYEAHDLALRQVDVATDGSLLSECGSSMVEGAVSTSGDRAFFTNPTEEGPCGSPRLFLRESGSRTVEISASRCSRPDCNEPGALRFAGATPDGSVAFLTTTQQLTNEDEDYRSDLYRFDVESSDLTLVTPDVVGMEGEVLGGEVVSSDDGSRTYFFGTGLAPGESNGLYLAQGGELRFVALGPADSLEITPDGRLVVFSTPAPLTVDDTDEAWDVYRYNAGTDSLAHLSTGPTGGNGPADAKTGPSAQPFIYGAYSRSMSEDGGRVFFNTDERLIAEDRNDARDVYEWASGSLGLVSSGTGSDAAEFAATSSDGSSVLFRSEASLVPSDRDGGDLDFYAARTGGGFDEGQPASGDCRGCSSPSARVQRRRAASESHRRQGGKRRIRLTPLGADAARSIVKTGGVDLELSVPAPGRVSALGTARLGGEVQAAARGVAGAVRRGPLDLRLAVAPAARRALARRHVLRLHLHLKQASLSLARTVTLRLEAAG